MEYLCSYKPLSISRAGLRAAKEYHLPPFIDGSIRREPDFQSSHPSITALCRSGLFAPKLHIDDQVAYITVKGRFGVVEEPHWRLVALLRVVERLDSHQKASQWYLERGLPLPSNCLVAGNPPVGLEKTHAPDRSLRQWDLGYQHRARKFGVFLICEADFLDLQNPPVITERDMVKIFRRVPGTQNPPKVSRAQFGKLEQAARSSSRC